MQQATVILLQVPAPLQLKQPGEHRELTWQHGTVYEPPEKWKQLLNIRIFQPLAQENTKLKLEWNWRLNYKSVVKENPTQVSDSEAGALTTEPSH